MPDNPEIDKKGTKRWRNKKGQLHRTDGPAAMFVGGEEHWLQNGERHRIGGPAIVYKDGSKVWYQNDLQHRTDGPAVIWGTGKEYWFVNGKEVKPIPNIICYLRKKLSKL